MSLFGNFNKVILVGNLTRDIELRTLQSGTRVCDFGLAVNDPVKKDGEWEDETTFVDITAWQKTAEHLERWGRKGKRILIEGRLKLDKWVDKESGQNRSKLKVVAFSVTFFESESKKKDDDDSDKPEEDIPYAQEIDDSVPF